jgi:hypothetical protein
LGKLERLGVFTRENKREREGKLAFFRYRSSVFVLSFKRSFPSIICTTRNKEAALN